MVGHPISLADLHDFLLHKSVVMPEEIATNSIQGHHGTNYASVTSIIQKGFIPGTDEDWFGKGAYFFVEGVSFLSPFVLARRWADFWGPRHGWRSWAVMAATISTDKMLDLTKVDQIKAFNEIRESIYDDFKVEGSTARNGLDAVIIKKLQELTEVRSVIGNVVFRFRRENKKNIVSAVPNATILCVYNCDAINRSSIKLVKHGPL